ncbi:MAG: hypothetical protein IKB71_02770 [Lentisphaeria bacterium]|nr:hypothetical protein [Lentisphaeria bacterium]
MRNILFSVLFTALLILLSGCYSFKNNHRTVVDVTNHFTLNGIHIDVIQPLFPYFNSENAISLKIEGKEIGIYKYNTNVPKQLERLKTIHDNRCVYVEGMKYPVLVNGAFMLLGYEVNPKRDRIIELFESFPNN